jgi:hypothetical protein
LRLRVLDELSRHERRLALLDRERRNARRRRLRRLELLLRHGLQHVPPELCDLRHRAHRGGLRGHLFAGAELKHGETDAHSVPRDELAWTDERLIVHVGAVRGAQILDLRARAGRLEPRMLAGHLLVLER